MHVGPKARSESFSKGPWGKKVLRQKAIAIEKKTFVLRAKMEKDRFWVRMVKNLLGL